MPRRLTAETWTLGEYHFWQHTGQEPSRMALPVTPASHTCAGTDAQPQQLQGHPDAKERHSGALLCTLALPYPPSINHYWVQVGPRRVVSATGRAYRQWVVKHVARDMPTGRPLVGRLAVIVRLYPASQRAEDIDNRVKALLDALERAHVYRNDNQIDALHVYRDHLTTGGQVVVEVYQC
jgi:crossover junction endodeoxyribonuclease RusA